MTEYNIEKFVNEIDEHLAVSDLGLYFRGRKHNIIIPRTCIRENLKYSMGSVAVHYGEGKKDWFFFWCDRLHKERLNEALNSLNAVRHLPLPAGTVLTEESFNCHPQESRALVLEEPEIIESEVQPDVADLEFRMRCNVCGHIFCYNMHDLERNVQLSNKMFNNSISALLELVAGSRIAFNQNIDRTERLESQIVNYSRCPSCHSSDISEFNPEETSAVQNKLPEPAAAPAYSPLDELKKLKELLDLGIVTQEEFDAKKKQLLGL